MLKALLTQFAFPGVPNGDPSPLIQRLKRTDANCPGDIEYVVLKSSVSSGIVFVSHGRLRALDHRSVNQWASLVGTQCFTVILHNYPGYGDTGGPMTEARLCLDSLQLATHILAQPWANGQELFVLGNSVGCGPTMWLASQKQLGIKKIVLISPYTSIIAVVPFWLLLYAAAALKLTIPKRLARWLGSPRRLSWLQGRSCDLFPSKVLVTDLFPGAEVLLVHGEADSTVMVAHSEALMKKMQDAVGVYPTLCIIPDTEHKDTRLRGDAAIWSFLKGQTKELQLVIADLSNPVPDRTENIVGTD